MTVSRNFALALPDPLSSLRPFFPRTSFTSVRDPAATLAGALTFAETLRPPALTTARLGALSEQAVLMARSLDYKFADLNGG